MSKVFARLRYQLQIEILEDGTFVATAVREDETFVGTGPNHNEALEDLALELDVGGIENELESGTMDDEDDS